MTLHVDEDEDLSWPEGGDSGDDTTPRDDASDPAPGPADPSPDSPEPPPDDDLDRLRQRVRSAEGRYQKFGEDIDAMRRELAEKEGREPEVPDTPVLPEGWTQDDWEDFATDSPTEAELLQANAREQHRLRQRLDDYDRHQSQQESINAFRQTVLTAHPDYEPLMAQEGDQVRAFIDNQPNPLVKKAYQQVYQQGTAEEVVELVNQYKLSRNRPDNRISDSLAVPSRSPVPDVSRYGGLPDANDEDAAWDYFDDEKI